MGKLDTKSGKRILFFVAEIERIKHDKDNLVRNHFNYSGYCRQYASSEYIKTSNNRCIIPAFD